MKDFLIETLKLEEKIRRGALLKDYYSGQITWLQYCAENEKLVATVKAITEEAQVKPSFRNELESNLYPLDYWYKKSITNKS